MSEVNPLDPTSPIYREVGGIVPTLKTHQVEIYMQHDVRKWVTIRDLPEWTDPESLMLIYCRREVRLEIVILSICKCLQEVNELTYTLHEEESKIMVNIQNQTIQLTIFKNNKIEITQGNVSIRNSLRNKLLLDLKKLM